MKNASWTMPTEDTKLKKKRVPLIYLHGGVEKSKKYKKKN
jgi:hypothetical protein